VIRLRSEASEGHRVESGGVKLEDRRLGLAGRRGEDGFFDQFRLNSTEFD